MTIFISSGHHDDPNTPHFDDTGATSGAFREATINMAIRDEVKELMPEVVCVPDDLNLRESIDWVNARCAPNDIAIEIHQNSNSNTSVRGTETYYDNEPEFGEILARNVSKALQVPNRGVRHDSESRAGSLGWIRLTKCSSALVECAYLSNEFDRFIVASVRGQMDAAQGIKNAIIEYQHKMTLLTTLVSKLREMVAVLVKLVNVKK